MEVSTSGTLTVVLIVEGAYGSMKFDDFAISPDGTWLAAVRSQFGVGDRDSGYGAVVWDAAKNHARDYEFNRSHPEADFSAESASKIAISRDGKWFVTASDERAARVWDVTTGKELAHLKHPGELYVLTISPNGEWFATASATEGVAHIWDARSFKQLATLPHKADVLSVEFSPDSKWLATATNEDGVLVWDAGTWAAAASAGSSELPSDYRSYGRVADHFGTRQYCANLG